jgi:isoleucyl-tRNA synthetase
MAFKEVDKQVNFPKMEEGVLGRWHEKKMFEQSLDKNRDKKQYVFYDGPPFATGLPHYGHILPGTIKDIVPRYMTMKGYNVERVWGWDCHGLPVENLIEKELDLNSKHQIEEFGIDKFNEACRSSVLRYTGEWEKTIDRMGRWVDFKNSYKTMELDYMESIWWVFHELWNKELIYEGFKILPYCPRCATPLSNFETNQGYKDVQDPAITVKFKVNELDNTYILAWTTTPWTLPSNMGLAVGEDIEYAKVEDDGMIYVLAAELVAKLYKDPSSVKVVETVKGSELVGLTYEPLFPYFAGKKEENAFRVVPGHHVSTDSGTGVVHIAPGFGEDDAEIGREHNLPTVCPVDEEGRYTDEVSDYTGTGVKAADKEIMKRLKEEGKLVRRDSYQHSYPHCWRCDEPLIYKAISSWFVDIQSIKFNMLESNKKINWVPEHIKEGRFGKWLEGARDWAISRNRYWGCPIPVWKCDSCDEVKCVGSVGELEQLTGGKVTDLHKHLVDPMTFSCDCGGTMTRIEEVLDCWFESGAMPYAQQHYPFENKQKFEQNFPAQFIAEGLDQTRGWFYTLVVLGTALFKESPFQNVVVNGLVLAEDGRKMSKRLKNYPEVSYIFDHYGADALRLFLMNSSAIKGGDLLFSEKGVQEVLRIFNLPLWNAYSFFVTYANVDGWDASQFDINGLENPMDIWLTSFTEKMVADIDGSLAEYDFQSAIKSMYNYLDSLTNWYIRLSRRRFWKSENDRDKSQAYSALYNALMQFCRAAAPVTPFLTDEIYGNLRADDMPESVHLCDYPVENRDLRNQELEQEMDLVQRAVEMGRSLRVKVSINLRKPLAAVHLVSRDETERQLLSRMEELILEELNVKQVRIEDREEELVTLACKPNFRVLGKKLGKNMKDGAQQIGSFGAKEVSSLEAGETLSITVAGETYELTSEDILIERTEREGLTVMNEGSLTVALDTNLTPELMAEGIAREFIRHIQILRKDSGLNVTDRIVITYNADDEIQAAVTTWQDVICSETLADSLTIDPDSGKTVSVNDQDIKIGLSRV